MHCTNVATGAWEVIAPSQVAAGSVTFATSSFSPFAIVKLSVTSNSTTATGTAATTATTSQQTGEALPIVLFVAGLGMIGAAVCSKKYFA